MSLKGLNERAVRLRILGALTCFVLLAMIGCGNTASGCAASDSGIGQGDPDSDNIVTMDDNCPETANADQADGDGDGVGDACDNCPAAANADQADADDDGVGDTCDSSPTDPNAGQADVDGDGFGFGSDNCPNIANPDQRDQDSDGLGDVCDTCPNDANSSQTDSDGDGVGDACDNCPSIANGTQADNDNDNVGNACDNCRNTSNPLQTDSDGDGAGNACEGDRDDDGIADEDDNCLTAENSGQEDEDQDGVGDACDNCPTNANADQADGDGDTVGNQCDNCIATFNPTQNDNGDEDGVGNACDNCEFTANAGQEDIDDDGVGDICDGDRDNDGIADGDDNCVVVQNENQADIDGDGRGDLCDNCKFKDNADQADTDNDTVGDLCDNCPNNANITQIDADGDGIGDACDSNGGGQDPVQVTVTPGDGVAPLCGIVELNAVVRGNGTDITDDAEIDWSVTPTSASGSLVEDPQNQAKATFWAPFDGAFTVRADAVATGYSVGQGSSTFTLAPFTKSSGAALVGETVTLDLDDDVTPSEWTTSWTPRAGNAIDVSGTFSQNDDRSATFVAPALGDPAMTTPLTFDAAVTGCALGTLTGSLTVSIQTARITLDFSAINDQIGEGDSINLAVATEDNGGLGTGEVGALIGGIALSEITVLFSVSQPGETELPAGVSATLDSNDILTIIEAPSGNTSIQIKAEVFGGAGSLGSVTANIMIVGS